MTVTAIVIKNSSFYSDSDFESVLKEVNSISNNVFVISDSPSAKDTGKTLVFNTNKDIINICNSVACHLEGDLLIINGSNFSKEHFAELHRVLYVAERHCAVSPRVSNAEFLSILPDSANIFVPPELTNNAAHNSQTDVIGSNHEIDIKPLISKDYYLSIKDFLPPYHIIPYPTSACVLIKGELIKKFGLFKDFSGNIEDALISWCLEINGYGYSSVVANNIFAENVAPCRPLSKAYEKNYPFIKKYCHNYLKYFQPVCERFASVIVRNHRKPRLLFSLYQLIPAYNGTSEHAFGIAERFVKKYSHKYEIHILITKETADFFNVCQMFDNVVYPDTICGVYDLGLTFTQIYFTDLLTILNRHCLKIVSTVLDLISFRCDYFNALTDPLIFKKSVEYSDGIITISHFTMNDLAAAFPDIKSLPVIRPIHLGILSGQKALPSSKALSTLPFESYILVFGNTLKHKAIENIIDILPTLSFNFIVIGYTPEKKYSNIKCYSSGGLSHNFIDDLYKNCTALIYPSQYEGFGLPVVNALKYGKKVIVSNTEINKELLSLYPEQRDNFIFFHTYSEIKTILETENFAVDGSQKINIRTYDEITEETEKFVDTILNEPLNYDRLLRRDEILSTVEYSTQSLRNLIKEYIKKKYPKLFKALRKVYKLVK